MTSALDMSLDDLIKNSKPVGRGRGGRGNGVRRGAANVGGYGATKTTGPARRQMIRATARPSPYATAKSIRRATNTAWQHDMYEDAPGVIPAAARSTGIETGTKLYISNLDYGVSNEDIKELFQEVGDLKRCSIHYDRSGRSKGTAEVVFSRKADGVAALRRYNNVQLDGKAMKIELIGTNLSTAITTAMVRASNGTLATNPGLGAIVMGTSNRGRGIVGGRRGASAYRGRGRGRGAGRGRGTNGVEKSVEDLDADLESYHAEAMQIS